MIIATIETKPILGQREGETDTEAGVFSLDVQLDEYVIRNAANIQTLVYKTIARYLASAYMDTGVPPPMWLIRFPPKMQQRYSFPETIDLEHHRDLSSFPVQ